jgi:hypothetical protein
MSYYNFVIVKALYILDNITQAWHAHCKEYLDKALDQMIKVRDTFCSISEQHHQDLNTRDVQTASAKHEHELVGLSAERAR